MPASIHSSFQGTAAAFQNSLANEVYLIIAALVVVYIVLGVLYESYIHPITILSTLPSAGIGAILALFVFRDDFNVVALIGVILLIGIVKKNAIMMIDFALEAERDGGKIAASKRSIRPVSPFPPHHDDHHGRFVRRIAAGLGHRRGLRIAASARHHDRRRTDCQPGFDLIHNAGCLPVL